MLFCGDLAVPDKTHADRLINSVRKSELFKDKTVVLNLEGVVKHSENSYPLYKLHNDDSVLSLRDECDQMIVSLANNHVYDYPVCITQTVDLLNKQDIQSFGLVENDAVAPYVFEEEGITYAIFGHCWDLYTKTNPNMLNKERVVDCHYEDFYLIVKMYAKNHPNQRVVCFMHWNFDFENLPFPALVNLSHDMVDAGVWCVIGNHTHCVQPWEIYNGHLICYSLGNFCIPDNVYFNGKLTYPADSHSHLVVEVKEDTFTISECKTSPEGELTVTSTNSYSYNRLYNSELNGGGYDEYFKTHREKKRLTPIFNSYKKSFGNRVKMFFLIEKVKMIRVITRLLS